MEMRWTYCDTNLSLRDEVAEKLLQLSLQRDCDRRFWVPNAPPPTINTEIIAALLGVVLYVGYCVAPKLDFEHNHRRVLDLDEKRGTFSGDQVWEVPVIVLNVLSDCLGAKGSRREWEADVGVGVLCWELFLRS